MIFECETFQELTTRFAEASHHRQQQQAAAAATEEVHITEEVVTSASVQQLSAEASVEVDLSVQDADCTGAASTAQR